MKTFDLVCQHLSDSQLVLHIFLTNPRILDHESGCLGSYKGRGYNGTLLWINSTVSLNILTLIRIGIFLQNCYLKGKLVCVEGIHTDIVQCKYLLKSV